ncbi:DUF72 domain-containing protein [Myxococcota bacterium]|nr:DUF72 domain-containing protein [Myxococcota bacterium]
MATLSVGTSGWVYPHWRGPFYPDDLPARAWLGWYARAFDAVEVNATFYRLPSRRAAAAWREAVPEGFLFAVKGSRFVTHVRRLKDPAEPIARLEDRIAPLGEARGPVLWQLPPRFPRDLPRLQDFLAALPPGTRHAFEFRDPSWFAGEVYAALDAAGAALVVADRDGRTGPLRAASGWAWFRFHGGLGDGGAYTDGQIAGHAATVAGLLARGVDVLAFFNNDWGAHAVADAARLREAVADLRSPRPRAR